jgi:hypothetical protein
MNKRRRTGKLRETLMNKKIRVVKPTSVNKQKNKSHKTKKCANKQRNKDKRTRKGIDEQRN